MDKNVHVFGNLLHILTIFDWKITNIHRFSPTKKTYIPKCQIYPKFIKIEQKWSKIEQKWSKVVENGEKLTKMSKNWQKYRHA